MKNMFKKLSLSFLLLTFIFSSCDEGFSDLNVNPTQANDIDPAFQISYVMLQTSGERYENWRAVLIYSSTMIQHLAALPTYWSGDKYLYNASYSASLFDRAYNNQIRDITDLYLRLTEQNAAGEPVANLLAVTKIWRAVIFMRLTDLYGDIPYSEAGLGFEQDITMPKYDEQAFIYDDMLKEIEEGIGLLTDSQDTFGSADLIFGGDIAKWKKFGYSLMLRLGMRQTKVTPNKAEEWVKKAIAGGVMDDLSDSAMVPHTDGPGGINNNGIGDVFAADGNQHLSKTFVDWMRDHGDPRLDIFSVVPAEGAPHKGLPNGYDATTIKDHPEAELDADGNIDMDTYSDVNPVLVTRENPMIFQMHAEVELLLAEAALRGWHSGDAKTHYESGVRSSMKQWGEYFDPSIAIDDAAIDAYLAANPFDNTMKMVGDQYWGATFLHEYEAYNNYRRTGFPELVEVEYEAALPITGGKIPRRLAYPQSEAGINGDNLNDAIARQGLPQDFAKMLNFPVWWDKQ